jgi:hypothetical protein
MKLGLMRFVLFFLSVVCLGASTYAKELEPRSLRIYPDLESGWFLTGQLHFGCEVTYENGGKRRSTGYLNGNLPWSEFFVESEQAISHGDFLLVDLFKVRSNQQTLVIKVRLSNFPHVQSTFELRIPPVESVNIFLPNANRARFGRKIKPHIHVEWANRFGVTFNTCKRNSLVPMDSVQIYLNDTRSYDCRVTLPEKSDTVPQTFSLSVIWTSKSWMNDTEIYPFNTSRLTGKGILTRRKEVSIE